MYVRDATTISPHVYTNIYNFYTIHIYNISYYIYIGVCARRRDDIALYTRTHISNLHNLYIYTYMYIILYMYRCMCATISPYMHAHKYIIYIYIHAYIYHIIYV